MAFTSWEWRKRRTLGKFTGLEWILREIHRAGMDFTGDSPGWNDFHRKYTGWYEFTRRITGLLRIFVEIHRAGTDPSQGSPGCNGFNKGSPGCNGFNCRITGLFWVYPSKICREDILGVVMMWPNGNSDKCRVLSNLSTLVASIRGILPSTSAPPRME